MVGLQAPQGCVERAADESRVPCGCSSTSSMRRRTSSRARPGRAGPGAPRRGSSRCRRGCRRRRPCRRTSPPPRAPRPRPPASRRHRSGARSCCSRARRRRPRAGRVCASSSLHATDDARPCVRRTDTASARPAAPGSDPTTRPHEPSPRDRHRTMQSERRPPPRRRGQTPARAGVRPDDVCASRARGQSPGPGRAGRVRTARWRRARAASCRG